MRVVVGDLGLGWYLQQYRMFFFRGFYLSEFGIVGCVVEMYFRISQYEVDLKYMRRRFDIYLICDQQKKKDIYIKDIIYLSLGMSVLVKQRFQNSYINDLSVF